MEKSFVCETDSSGVARVVLNRPKVRNAFDRNMISELTELFSSFGRETRLIVLSGEGKSFCAGADINWMRSMKNYTQDENLADSRELANLFKTMDNCPVPLVAKVHGAALGGGAGLLSVCDYVIAERSCKIGFTEVRLGLLPAVISPFVRAKIGTSWARAMIISGEIFSADRACQMGLVHSVASGQEELDLRTQEVVKTLLTAGIQAVREAKVLLQNIQMCESSEQITDYTCNTIARIRVSDEAQEGMSALLEKRPPSWVSK